MSEPATEASATRPKLGENVRRNIALLRVKLVRFEVVRRLALALAVGIVGLSFLLVADWWVDFAMDVRLALLLGLGVLVAVLMGRALAALVTQQRDDEAIALMVEREEPGFRSRLIASVQFGEGKAAVLDASGQKMVQGMIDDTEDFASPSRFANVVNPGPLKRALAVLFVLGALGAGGYFAGGVVTRDLLKRAFLSDIPVPRATRIVGTSGDLKMAIGDSVTLEVEVEGDQPSSGTLDLRFGSGSKKEIRMEAVDGQQGHYAATIENVQESFTYVARVRDGKSNRHQVQAFPRPMVEELVGQQTYPAYTKLDPGEHKPGEFLLFPGSKLDLTITSTLPLESGTVRLLGAEGQVTTKVDEDNSRLLRASFTVPERDLSGFMVSLLDTNQMESKDATVYRLDIIRDEPPKVRIVRPSRQLELVTQVATVLLSFEAEDRFGVERVSLHYAVAGSEPRSLDLPIASPGSEAINGQFKWALGEVEPPLQVGDEIEYWVEAHDQNAETPAGKSARKLLKVVTAQEKRNDLLARAGDFLGRVGETTDAQERLNVELEEWIRSQTTLSNPEPPETQNEKDNDE
jgi:hypothetical protein